MTKSYWFEHDYNAANDAKILFLRQQLGMEGYGIYWFIVEQLVQSGGKLPLKIIPVLAMQSQTQESKVSAIIHGYELFHVEQDHFFSIRLNKHIDTRKYFSEMGKLGVEKREAKRGASRGASSGALSKTDRHTDKQTIRGLNFLNESLEVVFEDGSTQRLGEVQALEYKNGRLLAKQVIKGEIY